MAIKKVDEKQSHLANPNRKKNFTECEESKRGEDYDFVSLAIATTMNPSLGCGGVLAIHKP